jgi:hypothetical protein
MPSIADYVALVPALRQRFEAAPARYADLAAAIRPNVVTYQWADGARHALQPLHFVLGAGGPAGKPMKSEPKNKAGKFRYGYGAGEEVLLEEQYTEFAGRFYEEFHEPAPGGRCSTLYDYTPDKDCINVQQLFVEHGVPAGFVRYAQMGVLAEAYEYHGDRLVRVVQDNRMHDPQMPASYSFRRVLDLSYQADRIWRVEARHHDGRSELLLDGGELL